jgi:hypothetical protein
MSDRQSRGEVDDDKDARCLGRQHCQSENGDNNSFHADSFLTDWSKAPTTPWHRSHVTGPILHRFD